MTCGVEVRDGDSQEDGTGAGFGDETDMDRIVPVGPPVVVGDARALFAGTASEQASQRVDEIESV